jgi:hypothetical protein
MWGSGIPVGILPASSTRAMESTHKLSSVGITSAITAEKGASRVRPSPTNSASAATPASREASSIRDGCRTTSSAFSSARSPVALAPRRSGIWPKTMFTATPVRKPIITENETNRVNRPRRRRPAASITAPASTVSMNSASGRSAALKPSTADPAASAAAVVVVITISRVLAVSPPAIGPAKLA